MSHTTTQNALREICKTHFTAEQKRELQAAEDELAKVRESLEGLHPRAVEAAVQSAESDSESPLEVRLKKRASAVKARDEAPIRRTHFEEIERGLVRQLQAPCRAIVEKLLEAVREAIANPSPLEVPAPLVFWNVGVNLEAVLRGELAKAEAALCWELENCDSPPRATWIGRWYLIWGGAIEPRSGWERYE